MNVHGAEGGGFEPPEGRPSTVFKTVAIVRSAIPPGPATSPGGWCGHREGSVLTMAGETPPDVKGTVVGLVGVYHANGSLWGEVTYWLGARVGRAHCALCDITHGTFRRRPEWETCAAGLGVSFDTFHLDDQPDDVRAASSGATPSVLARLADGSLTVLVGPEELERCSGQPNELAAAIHCAVDGAGLVLGPVGPASAGA